MSEQSTTSDLLARMRRMFESANRRDWDALMSFLAPDAVMETGGMGTHEGLAAIRGFFEDWIGAYDEFEIQLEELLDLGGGVTFAVILLRGRPVGSSSELRRRYAVVAVGVDDLLVRFTNYFDIDEGRAAAERLAESGG